LTSNEPLTKHERELLGIIQQHGDWMTRRAIAKPFRQGLLTTRSIHALNRLVAAGLVEVRDTQSRRGGGRFEYRAVTQEQAL
jgi:predicted transcriptional regulator